MKGLTMVQWINLNRNNRSVLAHRYFVLWEKPGPILLQLVGIMVGRQADEIQVDFESFKILYRHNYSDFQCNVTTVLELHFSRLLSSKAYFKACFEVRKAWLPFFSCQSLLLGTNISNDICDWICGFEITRLPRTIINI